MTDKLRLVLPAARVLALCIALVLTLGQPALGALTSPASGERPGQDLQALPIGQLGDGQAGSDAPATFRFTADTAGFLTVVVRGTGEADLRISVTDEVGFPLPGGTADQDIGGNLGSEQLTVLLPRAGVYQIFVETYYGSTTLKIGGAWIPYPDASTDLDPDGHPDMATPLSPGSPVESTIDGSAGDSMDWYAVTSDTAGMVTVIVEAPEGDLSLEVYRQSEYRQPVSSSDQDMGGVAGNESLTVRIEAGETLYFKVAPVFSTAGQIAYTIRAGVM